MTEGRRGFAAALRALGGVGGHVGAPHEDDDRRYRAPLRWLLIAGVVIVLAGAAATAYVAGRLTERELLDVEARHVAEHVRGEMNDHLRGPRVGESFEQFAKDMLSIPGAFRVKVWDGAGRIVWANDARLIGRAYPDHPLFLRARAGELVSGVVKTVGAEREFERRPRRVREIYVPVPVGVSPDLAVVELYLDAGRIEQQIRDAQLVLGVVSIAAALGLFALLALAVWRASVALAAARAREAEGIEGRLRLVERLRAFGEVAAGATHDLGNVLMVASGRTDLLARSAPPEMRASLENIRRALGDGMEIMHRLHGLRRPDGRTDFEPVCLRVLVADVVRMTEPRWQKCHGVEVHTTLDEVPPVLGRPSELREVVMNLVLNALDAMPEGGRLGVATSRSNGHARVEITDTGIGMPDDVRRRLFVPFVTTKPNGTGLGLSVSYGIVKRHGGRIDVETAPGKGTRFTVALPVAVPSPAAPAVPPPPAAPAAPATKRTPTVVGMLVLLVAMLVGGVDRAPAAGPEEEGRVLIQRLGCPVCHDIPGETTTVRKEAPDLTFEGDRVQPDWLFAFLKAPGTIRPAVSARMPNFRLTDEEALALTDGLGTLRDRGAKPLPPAQQYRGAATAVAREAAQKLTTKDYFDCFSCHFDGDKKPAGKQEEWGPDLARLPQRVQPDWIVRWLSDPSKIQPGTKMPAFFPDDKSGPDDILNGDELAQMMALRDWLASASPRQPNPAYARARAEHPEATATVGRSLLVRLNCTGCHRIAGFPEGRRVGPHLGFQGSRVKREWLLGFLRKPGPIKPEYAIMGSDARMPDFRLTDREAEILTDYIMTKLRDPKLQPVSPETFDPKLAPEGERLFAEKFCDNCHRIGDRPGGIGPELTFAGRRLNPAWVYHFVLNPSHYLDTRMPNLKLTESEARAVTAYLIHRERLP